MYTIGDKAPCQTNVVEPTKSAGETVAGLDLLSVE